MGTQAHFARAMSLSERTVSLKLNGKIPFRLPESLPVAHKTGEDDGITHDCGIVYADEPFVLCFCANHVDVPACERLMQDIAWELVYEKR